MIDENGIDIDKIDMFIKSIEDKRELRLKKIETKIFDLQIAVVSLTIAVIILIIVI